MKTLIPILFAILLLGSCEKEPTHCYTCERHSYWDWSVILYSHDYCDMTTEEMLAMERKENEILDTYRCEER
jgi:hypothetical protein